MRKAVLSLIVCLAGLATAQANYPGMPVNFSGPRNWEFTGSQYIVNDIAVQSDGKIILGGNFSIRVPLKTTVAGKATWVYLNVKNLIRLNADGSLDTNYLIPEAQSVIVGSGGWTSPQQGLEWGPNAPVRSLELNSTETAVFVSGDFSQYGKLGASSVVGINLANRSRILELDSTGSLSSNFPESFLGGINNSVRGIYNLDDTNVVVYGDFTTVEMAPVGYVFGGTTAGGAPTWSGTADGPVDFALETADGLYLAGEFANYQATAYPRLVRVVPATGVLDGAFLPAGTGPNARVRALVVGAVATDVILVGDFTDVNGTARGRIARVNNVGTLDAAFPAANAGNSSGANGNILSIVQLPDGRYLIAGSFTTYNGVAAVGLARLEADGSLDTTFTPPANLVSSGSIFGIANGSALDEYYLVYGHMMSQLTGDSDRGLLRIKGGRLPIILTHPLSTGVNVGEPLVLDVTATDNNALLPISGPLFYQWQKNGKNIPGATSNTLNIPAAASGDAGNYRVLVTKDGTTVTSNVAYVWIMYPLSGTIPAAGFRAEGIVEPDAALNRSSGGKVSLLVDRLGAASGTLQMLAPSGKKPASYKFTGQFNSLGVMTAVIPRTGLPSLALTLNMNTVGAPTDFDLSDGSSFLTDGINSAVVVAWNNRWSKTLPATGFAGSYNVGLETSGVDLANTVFGLPEVSQGFGYFSMGITASTGEGRIAGVLADGTTFSGTGIVWGNAGGTLPLWIPLYNSGGALVGPVNINQLGVDKPVTAALEWTKPAGLSKQPDFFGFEEVSLTASARSGLYKASNVVLPAPPGNFSLTFDDGLWTVPQGGLSAPFSQLFSVVNNKATTDLPNPRATTISINSKTGLITGQFTDTGRKVSIRAMILTQGGVAIRGQFVMPNTASSPAYYVGGSVSN